ncbi:MAG TPA: hypothetical protein VGY97_07620 [Solirubrobacteraceae bacterium]|jgi:hypothetical protein|nr:hypothetical protein [Solirubrobacteraceae bacterium]
MAKIATGAVVLGWGAAVLFYAADGHPALRPGLDGVGFVIALLLAGGLLLAGSRTLARGLRER